MSAGVLLVAPGRAFPLVVGQRWAQVGVMETATQPVQPSVESTLKAYRINAGNASSFGKLSADKRRANKALRLANAVPGADSFVYARLIRVRAQLERVDAMLAVETDAQKLDRLASAQARLSVQEFALAGRPMPGSRRPGRESAPSKRAGDVGPVE